MQVNPLLRAISGPWLLESSTANALLPVLDQFLAGQTISFSEEKPGSFLSAFSMASGTAMSYESLDEAPEGSVAIINLSGVMMREDSCFSYGTETLAAATKAAYEHPNIAAIVKVVATGGGSVDGTETYAQVYGASPKPKVTFVKGLIASAGYWVGSQGDHIMLEGKTTMVGSIGTQIELTDRSQGQTRHLIRATESKDKNEDYQQAFAGNYEPIRVHVLDPLNSVFLQEVKAARKGKLDLEKNPLTGKMYVGQDAIDMGLADSFGTLEDAINLALELASKSENANQTHNLNQNTMFGKNKFTAVAALVGLAAVTAEQVTAANDELEEKGITAAALISAEEYNALKAKADQVEGLTQQVADLKAAKETAEGKASTLETNLKAAQDLAASYGSQPGATPTTPATTGNELTEEVKQAELDEEAKAYVQIGHFLNG